VTTLEIVDQPESLRAAATIDSSWDVIVVGSGLGGLSAASALSHQGLRVLVLEQHVVPGGYAHRFLRRVRNTKRVYNFDVALHMTGDLQPGRRLFHGLERLGVLGRIGTYRFDTAYRCVTKDSDIQVPSDATAYRELLERAFPAFRDGIHDLFEHIREIDVGAVDCHELSRAAKLCMGLSLQTLIEQHVKDPRFLTLFTPLWPYLGLPPSQMCAFTYLQMWSSFHFGGCYYIKGGGQSLSNAFVSIIEKNGGCVVLKESVAKIETQGGRVVGVRTEKERTFRAPVVISNASAPATFDTLLDLPALAERDRLRVAASPVSVSIHEAYVGLRGDAAALGLSDRLLFKVRNTDLDTEWNDLQQGRCAMQSSVLANHNLSDPGCAPDGCSIVNVAMLANGRPWMNMDEATYRDAKTELSELLVERLVEELPDVRERIEILEVGTPRTMHRYSRNPDGAIYGIAAGTRSHTYRRPSAQTGVEGLYLAGAWTFPSGGFVGSMVSGLSTADRVASHLLGDRRDPTGFGQTWV